MRFDNEPTTLTAAEQLSHSRALGPVEHEALDGLALSITLENAMKHLLLASWSQNIALGCLIVPCLAVLQVKAVHHVLECHSK